MKFLIIIILLTLFSCRINDVETENKHYQTQLSFFRKEFIEHFPHRLTAGNLSFSFRSNTSIEYQCIMMELSITCEHERIVHISDSLSNISRFIYNSNDSCIFIINRFHNKKNVFYEIKLSDGEKAKINNACYKAKLPMPNFYMSWYATNETEWKLPKDFIVCVLEARKGKYWNDEFLFGGKYMPPEWEHGYSKGVAISKMRNIIIYWFVIW